MKTDWNQRDFERYYHRGIIEYKGDYWTLDMGGGQSGVASLVPLCNQALSMISVPLRELNSTDILCWPTLGWRELPNGMIAHLRKNIKGDRYRKILKLDLIDVYIPPIFRNHLRAEEVLVNSNLREIFNPTTTPVGRALEVMANGHCGGVVLSNDLALCVGSHPYFYCDVFVGTRLLNKLNPETRTWKHATGLLEQTVFTNP